MHFLLDNLRARVKSEEKRKERATLTMTPEIPLHVWVFNVIHTCNAHVHVSSSLNLRHI